MLRQVIPPGLLSFLAFLALIPLEGSGTAVRAVALAVLAAAFGFDNMIVVKPFVEKLGRWRILYRTVGMFVMLTVLGLTLLVTVVTNADPRDLGAFSGPFFVMICVWHFAGGSEHLWLRPVEAFMKRRGVRCKVVATVIIVAVIAVGAHKYGLVFGTAGVIGIAFFLLLNFVRQKFNKKDGGRPVERTSDALRLLLVIEWLECAFGFDATVGAIAIKSTITAVLVGLAAGSLLMRTAVVAMVERGTLDGLFYMESGAHWSMGVLGVLMLLGVWAETPDWLEEASCGGIIIAALVHSILRLRRTA